MERMRRRDKDKTKAKRLEDPFLRRDVECPVCEETVEQLGMKTNLYRAAKTDDDLRPHGFTWSQEDLARYHPPLYYVWLCPMCYFAAGRKYYEDPIKDCVLPQRKFREGVLTKYREDRRVRKVVDKLVEGVVPQEPDFKQAIQMHLLAAFWLEQFDEFRLRDAMNLGRYYLRVAWLLRDISDSEELTREQGPFVQTFLEELKTIWPDVPTDEETALRQAIRYYEVTLSNSEIIANAVDELNVVMIIARLYLRLGETKPALSVLSSGVASGMRAKQDADAVVSAPTTGGDAPSEKERAHMARESTAIRGLIERARTMLDRVKEDWDGAQTQRAEIILLKNYGKPRSQLRAILEKEKIEPRIIKRLLPGEDKPAKKKGVLAKLFGG